MNNISMIQKLLSNNVLSESEASRFIKRVERTQAKALKASELSTIRHRVMGTLTETPDILWSTGDLVFKVSGLRFSRENTVDTEKQRHRVHGQVTESLKNLMSDGLVQLVNHTNTVSQNRYKLVQVETPTALVPIQDIETPADES
jgi:hypothetical protein